MNAYDKWIVDTCDALAAAVRDGVTAKADIDKLALVVSMVIFKYSGKLPAHVAEKAKHAVQLAWRRTVESSEGFDPLTMLDPDEGPRYEVLKPSERD